MAELTLEEPAALRDRPHVGGLPIPWVTYVSPDGRPDFRVHVEDRRRRVAEERRCQLCGTEMEGEVTFIGFQWSLSGMRFGEPPAHRACLDYALAVCPWLGGRGYSERGHAPETRFVTHPEEPGVMVLYTCKTFEVIPDPSGETELVYLAGWATRTPEWIRRTA